MASWSLHSYCMFKPPARKTSVELGHPEQECSLRSCAEMIVLHLKQLSSQDSYCKHRDMNLWARIRESFKVLQQELGPSVAVDSGFIRAEN